MGWNLQRIRRTLVPVAHDVPHGSTSHGRNGMQEEAVGSMVGWSSGNFSPISSKPPETRGRMRGLGGDAVLDPLLGDVDDDGEADGQYGGGYGGWSPCGFTSPWPWQLARV